MYFIVGRVSDDRNLRSSLRKLKGEQLPINQRTDTEIYCHVRITFMILK